jgi:hypothetical protein
MAAATKRVITSKTDRRFLILSDAILAGTNGTEEARLEQMRPLKPEDFPTGIQEAVLIQHGCDIEWLMRSGQIQEVTFS